MVDMGRGMDEGPATPPLVCDAGKALPRGPSDASVRRRPSMSTRRSNCMILLFTRRRLEAVEPNSRGSSALASPLREDRFVFFCPVGTFLGAFCSRFFDFGENKTIHQEKQ